ncbi:MAG: hypothetical protein U0746_14970 [Gemmataceae bacterium]
MRTTLCLLLALTAPGFAEDDATRPYELQVIVRIAPHRLLTAGFRRQLVTELHDGLQAGFGPLAAVEVMDAAEKPEHWLEPESLDGQSTVGPIKRHFVRVEFVDGRYLVAARQLDGPTGLASPVVRRAQTSDRAYVGRLALQFIDLDFGVTAAIAKSEADRVRLTFRGGALPGVDWARRVPKGTVFAVSGIVGSPARGKALAATYVQATEAASNGGCEGRLVTRYVNPLTGGVPYRALALGATSGPVRLRFVDADGLPHQSLTVSVSAVGFGSADPVKDAGAIRDGNFLASGPYDRLAFVRVDAGGRGIPIPVAVVDDRVAIHEVRTAVGDEARQQVEMDARSLQQRFVDILRRLGEQHKQLAVLLTATKNAEALERVQASVRILDGELTALTAEMQRVRDAGKEADANVGAILEQCGTFLTQVRTWRDTHSRAEAELQKEVEKESSPEAKEKKENYLSLMLKAESQRKDADIEGAIATYEEVLAKHGERPEVRTRLKNLQEEWKLKGPEHKAAREFTYGPWAKVKTLDELYTALPKARQALEALRQAQDRLTALKMFLVATGATNIVSQVTEEASKLQSDDAKLTLRKAEQVNKDLGALIQDLGPFVQSK